MFPSWLPGKLRLDGTWEETLAKLYGVFVADFVRGRPEYLGKIIVWDSRKLDGKYEEVFWHLISRGDLTSGERLPDYPRAEKLPWCAPTIANCSHVAVTVWDYLEGGGRQRTYFWLRAWDYVIVLEKRKSAFFLVTAFHVDGASSRRNLEKKYSNRIT